MYEIEYEDYYEEAGDEFLALKEDIDNLVFLEGDDITTDCFEDF